MAPCGNGQEGGIFPSVVKKGSPWGSSVFMCSTSSRPPPDCAGCKEEIKQGQSLLALEKQWHVSCFKCQTCGIILTGEYISK